MLLIPLQWAYSEFIDILPSLKSSNEFIITLKKGDCTHTANINFCVDPVLLATGKKNQNMTFSCDYRAEVLTEVMVSPDMLIHRGGQQRNETTPGFYCICGIGRGWELK